VGSGDNRPAATLFNSCATGRVTFPESFLLRADEVIE
jgi:hypothetical protein